MSQECEERSAKLSCTVTSLPEVSGLYYPGGINPVCSLRMAREMVRSGWLVERDGRWLMTPEGQLAVEDGQPPHCTTKPPTTSP